MIDDHDDHFNNMSTMMTMTKIMMMIMVKVTWPPSTVATGNGAESEALPPEEKITLMLRHYHHFHRHDHNSSSLTLHGNIYPKEMGVRVCFCHIRSIYVPMCGCVVLVGVVGVGKGSSSE